MREAKPIRKLSPGGIPQGYRQDLIKEMGKMTWA